MESHRIKPLESYSVRGLSLPVHRVQIGRHKVDYWAPKGSRNLIIAHDGQNVFDRRTATRGFTWRLAQQASEVFQSAGLNPPTIVAVFNSSTAEEPHGRALDLTPEKFFKDGLPVLTEVPQGITLEKLRGDQYLDEIFESVIPTISRSLDTEFTFTERALLGSSMGGLSTLYEVGREPERYSTALAFSPHWVLGGDALVEKTIESLPVPGNHRIWMSRGTRKLDRDYEPHQLFANQLMFKRGWSRENFTSKVYRGAGHNERAWAKQVADALEFWLGRN
jgi:enterochelin esterase-like enzyme